MRKVLVTTLLVAATVGSQAQVKNQSHGYPIDPIPFTSVKVTDSFWGQRLNASREVTIPLAFSKCEETGRYQNFVNATHPSDTIKVGGLAFDDTDVYKTIEGASYLLQTYPDKKLAKYIDSVLVIVAAAQEPDGYLYTSRTMNPKHPHEWAGSKRWEKVEDLSHEFYNLGHMVEGAIAHYQATGKKNFLNIAIRYADCVCREIGTGEGQQIRVPGHQIAEMALAKLYLVTGDQKYLDQAKFFLDQRGYTSRTDEYSQAHKPVVQQETPPTFMPSTASGTISLARNITSPAVSELQQPERLSARTTNCPTCQPIARLVLPSATCTSTTVFSSCTVNPNTTMYWNALYTMV